MVSRASKSYQCPICKSLTGQEENYHIPLPKNINPDKQIVLTKLTDYVYKDDLVSSFISSFWLKTVEGHVIVVPNQHYENLYDLPKNILHHIAEISQKIAIAIKKAYNCHGITLRQNNEPAGDQHAFHYHLHIFPRYTGDQFNLQMTQKSILSKPKDRVKYAKKIKRFI